MTPEDDVQRTATRRLLSVRRGMSPQTGSTSGFGGLTRVSAIPGAASRPYGEWFDGVVDVLEELLGDDAEAALEAVIVDQGELTLVIARDHIVSVCRHLRDDQDLRFELSLGVSGVHYPHDTGRELHAAYHLTSITHRRRLRLEVAVPDADPHIPSTTSIYPANNWHERETYDFFGLIFDDHPSLARIAMPDDWIGHPQRKDYPLGGIGVEFMGATIPPPDERRAGR